MSDLGSLNLDVDFDDLDTEEIDNFLQEGSRGIPEYAASCCGGGGTIAFDTTIINNSCAQASPDAVADDIDL